MANFWGAIFISFETLDLFSLFSAVRTSEPVVLGSIIPFLFGLDPSLSMSNVVREGKRDEGEEKKREEKNPEFSNGGAKTGNKEQGQKRKQVGSREGAGIKNEEEMTPGELVKNFFTQFPSE